MCSFDSFNIHENHPLCGDGVTLIQLVTIVYHLDTNHIGYFPSFLPQFHVVDVHNRNFPPVLDNISFFHCETAVCHQSIVPCESIHEKEFLYTTPSQYVPECQSRKHEGDLIDHLHHIIPQLCHILIHGEQYQYQVYVVDNSYSQTKR